MSEGGNHMIEEKDSAQWVKRVEAFRGSREARRLFYAILGFTVLLDLLSPPEHALFGLQGIPGFSAAYGLISCVLIIVVSKVLGIAWLMKREDYYD